jgi:hypothetical protein
MALAALLFWRRRPVGERGLLVALAVVGVLAIFLLDLTGKHIMITRYTVVTAPFLLTAIAAAFTQLPRVGAAALAAAVVAVSAAGLLDNHSRSEFYPPVKEAIEYIAPREHPGDFLLAPGIPVTDTPIFYYVTHTHLLKPKLHFFGLHDPGIPDAFRRYKRIWIIDNPRQATPTAAVGFVRRLLRRYHFRLVDVRVYNTSLALGLLLTVPDKARA